MAGIFKAYDVRGIVPTRAQRGDRAQDRPRLPARARRGGPRQRQHRRGEPRHALAQRAAGRALIEGLTAAGLDVVRHRPRHHADELLRGRPPQAAGGVQVTASHNPAQYNGFKFSRHDARPVSGDHGIALMEEKVDVRRPAGGGAPGHGHARPTSSTTTASTSSPSCDGAEGAKRLKVVVDAANGMGTIYRPILEAMGIELDPALLRARRHLPQPRGQPAQGGEPPRPDAGRCASTGADLGVSFDGDADRAAFVDENGAADRQRPDDRADRAASCWSASPARRCVYDLRSSRAVAEYIEENGGIPVRERVGPLLHQGHAAQAERHLRRRAGRPLLLPRQLLRRLPLCSPWSRS